jgi:peptidylprolyl isomerase
VPTNKQRREAARRHLERQLQRRQEREAVRKRFTMIASIAGTIVVIAVIVVAVVLLSSGSDDGGKPAAKSNSPSPTTSAPTSSSPAPSPSVSVPAATGPAATFDGVTVSGAKDLKGMPSIKSKHTKAPAKLEYKDLVVGTGKPATPKSTVSVQYVGALYTNGTVFDSSWSRGEPTTFPLTGVVPGFTQGIGGTKGVPPMKVGGRRLIIMPAALGYGSQANGPIPANSPLVFVVDLKKIS